MVWIQLFPFGKVRNKPIAVTAWCPGKEFSGPWNMED
jgi:hypothetical protein